MQAHPYAELFPMMTDAELQVLSDDIKANGLKELIAVDEDERIIDGRNRHRACEIAGVKPVFEPMVATEAEILSYVISKNLHRRHLDSSQRSMVAAGIATARKGGDRKSDPIKGQNCTLISEVTTEDAAKLLNVSPRSVKSARKVKERGVHELVDAVQAGEVAVSKAAEIASLPPDEQRAVLAGESVAEPEVAAATPEPQRIEPTVLVDSHHLTGLKRSWRKASKTDRKRFLGWAEIAGGSQPKRLKSTGMAAIDELAQGIKELNETAQQSSSTLSIVALRRLATSMANNIAIVVDMIRNGPSPKSLKRTSEKECTEIVLRMFGSMSRVDQLAVLRTVAERVGEPRAPKLLGKPQQECAVFEADTVITEVV